MNAVKRAANVLLSVILWAVILVAALYAFTTMATRDNQNVSNLFGYTPLVVKSDSMAPTFETGDLIVIKSAILNVRGRRYHLFPHNHKQRICT